MAIDAAVDGQGVALARTTLVATDLISGRLLRPFTEELRLSKTYWIICPRATAGLPKIVTFRDWLLAEAASDARQLKKLGAPAGVAEHAKAAPFDVDGSFWSDRDEKTTLDVMVEEFGLVIEPLVRMARNVRGADTGRLDLTPQSAGLLATCLGYSRMYKDDLAQLAAVMPQFDALYRCSRDAVEERHG
jgi:hypothetical protein